MTLSINKRMILNSIVFLISILSLFALLAVISIESSRESFIQHKSEQMTSISAIKKSKVESYFKERKGDMNILIETVTALREAAFRKLRTVQQLKKSQIELYLHTCLTNLKVIAQMKTMKDTVDRFSFIDETTDGDFNSSLYAYQEMLARDFLSNLTAEYGFLNLFIINTNGNVLFSLDKGKELGKNLINGDYKETGLGKCFQKGLEGIAIQDFEPYPFPKDPMAAFIATPVQSEEKIIGVIVVQLAVDSSDAVISMREGMGETGETFIVGKHDGKISFRCNIDSVDGRQYRVGNEVSAEYIESALSGNSVKGVFTDITGKLIIVEADPIYIVGLNWSCISKIDLEEAISPKLLDNSGQFYEKYVNEFGYYDLFLIHPQGKIFYTVKHESDYGMNVFSTELAESGLGRAIRKVIETRSFSISDYSLYAPSNHVPSAFIAQPILNNDQIELIVSLQIPIRPMNDIMHERKGMGKTGKTYLVGEDKKTRSDIVDDMGTHDVKSSLSHPTTGRIDTESVRRALAGDTETTLEKNYSGKEVISAFTPVNIEDITWALVSEIEKSEVIDNSEAARIWSEKISDFGILTLLLIVFVIFALLVNMLASIRNLVLKPLGKISDVAQRLARYDLSVTVENTREDEIGYLMKSVRTMIDSLREIITRTHDAVAQVASSAEDISAAMNEQAAIITEQASSITEISSTMEEFSASSGQVAENAATVVEIADDTLLKAKNGVQLLEVVKQQMDMINQDNQGNIARISELGMKTDEITKVMEIINSIVYQTKLIAFNAAIEASGAGEAGKRFGVVASEIRRLADSVAQSTGDIETKIHEIRDAGNHIILAYEKTAKGIEEAMPPFSNTVEMLTEIFTGARATTDAAKQISMSTRQQKTASEQIVDVLRDVSRGSEQTSTSINNITVVGKRLVALSDDLRQLLDKFTLGDTKHG